MKAKFRKEETINSILYLLQKLGGRSDIHRISKLLYFADQRHMMKYGRMITGDAYIAMNFGPVPSKVYDIFKYLRGDSYFSNLKDDVSCHLKMLNSENVASLCHPDLECLSETDIECLDESLATYGQLSFNALTDLSHGYAWHNTSKDRKISYKDMLREVDAGEDYADYVEASIAAEAQPFYPNQWK